MNKIGIIGPVPFSPFSPGSVATAHIPALATLRDYELRPPSVRAAAITIPAAFFLSVASLTAKQPNGLINLAYMGACFFLRLYASEWVSFAPYGAWNEDTRRRRDSKGE